METWILSLEVAHIHNADFGPSKAFREEEFSYSIPIWPIQVCEQWPFTTIPSLKSLPDILGEESIHHYCLQSLQGCFHLGYSLSSFISPQLLGNLSCHLQHFS
jgi:hypothetical protein